MAEGTTWVASTAEETENKEDDENNGVHRVTDVFLSSVAEKSIDCSGIDIDETFIKDKQYDLINEQCNDTNMQIELPTEISREDGYQMAVNDRHKSERERIKRRCEHLSPINNNVVAKQSRLAEQSKFENLVFIKGTKENITKLNSMALKDAMLRIDNTVMSNQIKYSRDSLKISCTSNEQKENLMEIKHLMGIEVKTSAHVALTRYSKDYNEDLRVIIFGVSVEIPKEIISKETGAIFVKRLLKKYPLEEQPKETENVVLTFASTPPSYVRIGIKDHKTTEYNAPVVRCYKCQKFGHVSSSCGGRTTCPKCAGGHSFNECPLNSTTAIMTKNGNTSNLNIKCSNCGGPHSSAFRGCPVYQERKQILEIKSRYKMSYADAVSKYKEMNCEGEETDRERIVEKSHSETQDSQEVFIVSGNEQQRSGNPSSNFHAYYPVSSSNQSFNPSTPASNVHTYYPLPYSLNNRTCNDSTARTMKIPTNLQMQPINSSFVALSKANHNAASTPMKPSKSQVMTSDQIQTNSLHTIFEEGDFPALNSSTTTSKTEFFEKLMDKFFKFIINLFQDLLSVECIINKFQTFVSSLNETNVTKLRGECFL